ncbi:hypothetical protein MRB53_027993 [Persea americana]|uniref:Uncharacterized protein n=1 Tax=Persea americana TaxID=3435 RepID=A0ACC2KEA8_PERAE|nr:hypothetical protein MRB53_027993 [Persea americana]
MATAERKPIRTEILQKAEVLAISSHSLISWRGLLQPARRIHSLTGLHHWVLHCQFWDITGAEFLQKNPESSLITMIHHCEGKSLPHGIHLSSQLSLPKRKKP